MGRAGAWSVGLLAGALVLSASARNLEPRSGLEVVVATGLARPLQLAVDGDSLLVLGLDSRGDAAGELYRIDLTGPLPVDLARQPRIQIPSPTRGPRRSGAWWSRRASRELFLGEENGGRIWRLGADNRLTLYATGLRRLMGGSTLAFDQGGRLLIVDHADPRLSPALEQFRDEDYRGPLLFRLDLDPGIRLPREVGRLAPFPRAGTVRPAAASCLGSSRWRHAAAIWSSSPRPASCSRSTVAARWCPQARPVSTTASTWWRLRMAWSTSAAGSGSPVSSASRPPVPSRRSPPTWPTPRASPSTREGTSTSSSRCTGSSGSGSRLP